MSTVELYISMVAEDFDPNLIGQKLQIAATSQHRKGEPLQFNKSPKFSRWNFSSGKIESERPDFYEISKSLLMVLIKRADQILEIKSQLGLEITLQCAIGISQGDEYPIIGFDSEVINFLAKIGASIDIDVYNK